MSRDAFFAELTDFVARRAGSNTVDSCFQLQQLRFSRSGQDYVYWDDSLLSIPVSPTGGVQSHEPTEFERWRIREFRLALCRLLESKQYGFWGNLDVAGERLYFGHFWKELGAPVVVVRLHATPTQAYVTVGGRELQVAELRQSFLELKGKTHEQYIHYLQEAQK